MVATELVLTTIGMMSSLTFAGSFLAAFSRLLRVSGLPAEASLLQQFTNRRLCPQL